jgi:hypothetical protein
MAVRPSTDDSLLAFELVEPQKELVELVLESWYSVPLDGPVPAFGGG